jgi:tyrosyl-tRNA synthetase
MKPETERVLASFARTTDQIFSLEELRALLDSGRKLTLKFGADVTAPDLHIGHAVNLWMYRELQELGHKIVFLIGDFTTGIGDPTGKSKLRPVIEPEQIQKNAEEFIRQVKLVLLDDPAVFEIRRNSEWLGQLSARDLLSLMSKVTNDHLRSRDMFRRRIEQQEPIYEHELIYPILQGYDSVALQSDITIIGSDQLFNEMMGRFFQEAYNQKPQVIITTKITPGIDGKEKQSKSLGNYIGLAHSPRDKFGRVMSIPDSLIVPYLEVYTTLPAESLRELSDSAAASPMATKLRLAREIVSRYHGAESGAAEEQWFKQTFSGGEIPADIQVIQVTAPITVFAALKQFFGESKSNSELRRLIAQKAVRMGEKTAIEPEELIEISDTGVVMNVGKRTWFKITK